MVSRTYLDGFIPKELGDEQCIKCGVCLQSCPVMKMNREESKA